MASKRLNAGRRPAGKVAVGAVKDRKTTRVKARCSEEYRPTTLVPLVKSSREEGATVYTDEVRVDQGLENRETAKHRVDEHVDGMPHMHGFETPRALSKRDYHGTFHHVSVRHSRRYAYEFAGRRNFRDLDTLAQMPRAAAGMVGRRLLYWEWTFNP